MKFITETFNDPLSLLLEADETGKKFLHIQGPFAVAEQKNKNGRIYPKHVMESAVDRYTNDYISPRKALGEMNHPCFKPGAKVFVYKKGLINIEDVSKGDYVYGTTKEGISKLSLVIDTTETLFSGELYNFDSRAFKATVTPYHRFYLKNRNGEFSVVTANDILSDFESGSRKLSHSYIPRTLENWQGDEEEYIELFPTRERKNTYNKSSLVMKFKDFCAFMGIYLSEGNIDYYTRKDDSRTYGEITITQNIGTNLDLIIDLVSKLGVDSTNIRLKRNGKSTGVVISDNRLADYLSQFGDCYTKFVPDIILNASKENIKEFLDWYQLGDGSSVTINQKGKDYTRNDVFTVSEKLADGLIECIIKLGFSTTKRVQLSNEDYMFAGRIIKCESKSPLFRMTIGKGVGKYVDERFTKINKEQYTGNVYCLVTETDNFMVEQNGTVFLSGNCRLNIDYERATHLITEMKQDGNVWIGKAKVLKTPMGKVLEGLLESGVAVGVSTRGAGSITESNGAKMVGDDFFMTSVDVVSDPSGPGCVVNSIMEGREFDLDGFGNAIVEDLAAIAKKEYDKKRLTEQRKVELFNQFIKSVQIGRK
jgi:hypothetical protein